MSKNKQRSKSGRAKEQRLVKQSECRGKGMGRPGAIYLVLSSKGWRGERTARRANQGKWWAGKRWGLFSITRRGKFVMRWDSDSMQASSQCGRTRTSRCGAERLVTFLLRVSVSREFEESWAWATKRTVVYAGSSTITEVAHITTLHISHNGALTRLINIVSSRCKTLG